MKKVLAIATAPARAQYLLMLVVFLLAGCRPAPTEISAPQPFAIPPPIEADTLVKIEGVSVGGKLRDQQSNAVQMFIGGFIDAGSSEVKVVTDEGPLDGRLEVSIEPQVTSTPMTKVKMVPLLGGIAYGLSGFRLKYDWDITVSYELQNAQGESIDEGSFHLQGSDGQGEGTDRWEQTASVVYLFIGAGPRVAVYPDQASAEDVGDEVFKLAGAEVAKRMRSGKAAEYLVARTSERDGMDTRTYAEFLHRKKSLKAEREAARRRQGEARVGTAVNQDEVVTLGGSMVLFAVGVNEYDSYPNLRYAVSDAKRFGSYFADKYSLSPEQSMVLTDRAATATKVKRFLEDSAPKLLAPEDTFVFYFSGHGVPDPDPAAAGDGDGFRKYLILSNSDPDALPLTAISLDTFAELIGALPCRRVLVFIDSCLAGAAGRTVLNNLKGLELSEDTYQNFAEVSGKGRVVMTASTENEFSREFNSLQGGVFTHYLLAGLEGEADRDRNGRVDVLELFGYVENQVTTYTRDRQHPAFRGSLDGRIEF